MNGNVVGARTLAYLRGENGLFQERERFEQARKQFQDSGFAPWMSDGQKRRVERFWKVASLLRENSRLSLPKMSRELKVPISTLFTTLKDVEKLFHFTIVLKEIEKDVPVTDTTPLEFAYRVTIDTGAETGKNHSPNPNKR